MAAGIAQLVRRAKPDRLLIEPSGLGHPAGLVDVLQGEHLRSSLQLQAILCLLDPTQVPTLYHCATVTTDLRCLWPSSAPRAAPPAPVQSVATLTRSYAR